ncbi:MAG: Uma2 family endonuclease [Cyanobacteria bacterium P01_D01_bin.36]
MTATIAPQHQPKKLPAWQQATWEEYVQLRNQHENSDISRVKLFFHNGALLVDEMGWEGISHATVRELFNFVFLFWFAQHSDQQVATLGGALFEKDGKGAGSPDLMLYIGEGYPQWTEGETRKINLNRWRAPDLVGEVSDTTLTSDLDQKKQLYASLKIAEYWVIDVQGSRVFLFRLDDKGQYYEVEASVVLFGLTAALLKAAMAKLDTMTNMDAALWFQTQIAQAEE